MSRSYPNHTPDQAPAHSQKMDIMAFTLPALKRWLENEGAKAFHAGQLFKWIYARRINDFDAMTDLGKRLRSLLNATFVISRPEKIIVESAADGTRKYLFRLDDGNFIESVLIPERNHDTLCISSQVGCGQGCRFCLTGQGGLIRNLTRAEILGQVREIQSDVKDPDRITNLVLMGMGEPLANYDHVVSALETITDGGLGMGFASRRVTLSTAGLVPKMIRLGQDSSVSLAVSLNATDNRTRDFLMPINRRHPIEKLIAACRAYPIKKHRKITFEYIQIKNVNDSSEDAKRLADILNPGWAKINLIPFNPFQGSNFSRPDEGVITQFMEILHRRRYVTIIRHSKGGDISAACGQLRVRAAASADQ